MQSSQTDHRHGDAENFLLSSTRTVSVHSESQLWPKSNKQQNNTTDNKWRKNTIEIDVLNINSNKIKVSKLF